MFAVLCQWQILAQYLTDVPQLAAGLAVSNSVAFANPTMMCNVFQRDEVKYTLIYMFVLSACPQMVCHLQEN